MKEGHQLEHFKNHSCDTPSTGDEGFLHKPDRISARLGNERVVYDANRY